MKEVMGLVADELRGAARYRWPAMILAWCVCAIGWSVVFFVPNKYEASARVFIDTRAAMSPVTAGLAVQEDMAAYLSFARESLVGEASLMDIMRLPGLGDKTHSPGEYATLSRKIRDSIEITVQLPNDRAQANGAVYSLSYRDSDRNRSLEVTKMLLRRFVQVTLGGKKQSSEAAETFLSSEIADNEKRLREAEQRLAEFKKHNVGVMPGAEGDYFTRLQNEMDAATKARTSLSVALARRDELTKQRRGEAPYASGAGAAVAAATGGAQGKPTDTPSLIADAEHRLAALLLMYTEKHPDVLAVREELAGLKKRRADELEALKRGDPDAALASGAGSNPIYQSIQLALNTVDLQIAELRGEINQHDAKIAELRKLVNSVPEVEAEFARLNRDYEVTKAQYAALVDRLKKAKLGQDAEAASAAHFEVIDPPNASFKPVSPNRPVLVVAIFLLAVAGGVGVAAALNKLHPVFYRGNEVFETTGIPILGEVRMTTLDAFDKAKRAGALLYSGGVVALVSAFVAILGFSIIHVAT